MKGIWQTTEVIGSSRDSIQAAVRVAITGSQVKDAKWFEVREIRGLIEGTEVEFQVRIAVGHERG